MKTAARSYCAIVLFALLAASCGPRATPTVAPTEAPVLPAPEATATPFGPPIQLVAFDLSGPEAGAEMQWPDGGSLVYVPGGEFQRGSGVADNPLHTLSLSPFWIYRTKVTNRMYRMCVAVGICSVPAGAQAASDLQNQYLLDRPVVDVTWTQAQAYCEWAQGSLPTEAQWELAARGLEATIYPWGDAAPTCALLNFDDCLGKTSRVFDYLNGHSPYNALDMAGNAFEWVGDWYDNDYYPNGPDLDPLGPRVGTERVVRSSSFSSEAADIPVSKRFHADPNQSRPDLGFRCVVTDPQVFAPYCQTSAYVPGDPGEAPPSRSCDLGHREIARDCGLVTHKIDGPDGVRLRSVEGSPPLATCEIVGDTGRVTCTGPASVTGVVTLVAMCGLPSPGDRPVDPRCFRDYEPVPGSEVTCEIGPPPPDEPGPVGGCPPGSGRVPGPDGTTLCVGLSREAEERPEPVLEGDCPGGTFRDADTGECPDALEPVEDEPRELEPVEPAEEETGPCMGGMAPATGSDGTPVCRGTTPDGTAIECPTDSAAVGTTDGRVVCVTRSRPGEPCPLGTSPWRSSLICAGLAREPGPGGGIVSPCLEGVDYDEARGCCQPPEGVRAGCDEGEYLDAVHGCQPRRDASGSLVTLMSFSASTGACGGPDGGDDPCAGLDKNSCYATAGCTWDDPGSFCH